MYTAAIFVIISLIWLVIGRHFTDDSIPRPDLPGLKFWKAYLVCLLVAGPFGVLIYGMAVIAYKWTKVEKKFDKSFLKKLHNWCVR